MKNLRHILGLYKGVLDVLGLKEVLTAQTFCSVTFICNVASQDKKITLKCHMTAFRLHIFTVVCQSVLHTQKLCK